MQRVLMMLFALVISACASAEQTASWLSYEPDVVTLRGTVAMEGRYGPPNYGESPDTDQKVTIAVLYLDKAVNVAGKGAPDDPDSETVKDVAAMQIIHPAGIKIGTGCKEITGTLMKGFTAHHYTSVLIVTKSVHDADHCAPSGK